MDGTDDKPGKATGGARLGRVGVLLLTSHAHAPPLLPRAALSYDLRAVENPPKAVRDSYTGVNKRLREHMLAQDGFVELLGRAEGEVRRFMEAVEREQPAASAVRGEGESSASRDVEEDGEEKGEGWDEDENDTQDDEGDGDGDSHEEDDGEAGRSTDEDILSVAAFCARGHHRSVAFVEELARRKWPPGWEVRVVHRDLGKARSQQGKGHGRGGRGGSRRAAGGFHLVHGDGAE